MFERLISQPLHNILVQFFIYFKIGHFLRKRYGHFLTEISDFRLQSSFCFWLCLVTINIFFYKLQLILLVFYFILN